MLTDRERCAIIAITDVVSRGVLVEVSRRGIDLEDRFDELSQIIREEVRATFTTGRWSDAADTRAVIERCIARVVARFTNEEEKLQ